MPACYLLSILSGFLLVSVVIAQPPQFNGRDSENLIPLVPPITASGSPSPSPVENPGFRPQAFPAPPPVPQATADPIPPPKSCRRLDCRTLTGQCTSTTNAMWGQARFAQLSYTGGSSTVPTGQNLKSAREISNIVCTQTSNTVNKHGLNELFTFFGQFLDHNFAATPANKKEPFDIDVPPSDPTLSIKKLPFKRSTRGFTGAGSDERPINSLPSAIDLAAVYGPDSERNNGLLEFDDKGAMTGKLKTSRNDLLPLNTGGLVNSPDTTAKYFVAGDHRSNEHPALTAMHTIFLREHNRLVDVVAERIPTLPGNLLYEFARKLNIAQFQKIVYEEFYPAIIGKELPRYRGFRRNVNPTISDIFAGAAFRIGHTLVGNNIPRRSYNGQLPPIEKPNIFFRLAAEFSPTDVDDIVRGVANSPAQEVDLKVVDLLRNFLFSNVEEEEGFDLVALNLQRGRDHALPKFNDIRAIFGIPKASSFFAITGAGQSATDLAKAYDSVDDVEAFVGLIGEKHAAGSGMGRTMEALWRAEFTRLRDGDQFFYLNQKNLPPLLRRKMIFELARIRVRSRNTFRELIVRNSAISGSQLPTGNIFNLKK